MSRFYTADDYECVVRKDEGRGWSAEYPDFPGVIGLCESRQGALNKAEETLNHWLTNAKEIGIAIPAPGEIARISGQFKVRLPKSFHRRLAKMATSANVSLNELILQLLLAGVARSVTNERQHVLLCGQIGASTPKKLPERDVDREFGGVWIQRAPRVLHVHLENIAASEGITLNSLVVFMLSLEYGALCADKLLASEENRDRAAA